MRIFLVVLGVLISAGALLVWLYLNALAAGWNTSNAKPSINWLNKEALLWFWLPFALGLAVAFFGWKRQ
ncbi:hypothetical protein AAFN88_05725 [Pelagibius sp. CAU 1746]|uniref:hypothetical protein n=1 Tax=Pelagibius sp. CAU 1746 TaxID=3140370 RepID=UPI00325B67A0